MPSAPVVLVLTKPLSPSFLFLLSLLTLCIVSWERRYCNSQAWLGLLHLGECCKAVLMSEAFSGLSESCLDRGAAQGLSKPVNIPPSEPPELPPSPLHTAKRRWITTTLERRYTFSALNGAVVRCSSASAGCLYRWV